jgi:diguanylate cyclase (GGDEF)-like protein/PAS domain S-box-containing protein
MVPRSIRFRLLGLVLAIVTPFSALVGGGLWRQWRHDQDAAMQRVLIDARAVAAQVDSHIGNLENLLVGLSRAVSPNKANTDANDALLRQIKAELPAFIHNIQVFSLDGNNIGTSSDADRTRLYAGDRTYFKKVLAGERLAIGDPAQARTTAEWGVAVARPVEDQAGRLQAVLAIGTRLKYFQDILRAHELPIGSIVRIVNEHGIVIARSVDSANWIGRDLSGFEYVARHIAAKEASEIVLWSDNVERITSSSTARTVPWLVSIGLPSEVVFSEVISRWRWSVFLSAVTLLTALVIAWMISGRIMQPLRQLKHDAATLAAGDLTHRSSIRTRDEIEAVACAFNEMVNSLDRRQQEASRAYEEIRRTQAFLNMIIENIPTMVFVKEALENRFILVNRAGEDLLGISRDAMIGKNDYDFFPKEQADFFVKRDREVLASGKLLVIKEEPIQTQHKGLRILHTKKMPVFDEQGQPKYLLGVSEDITDRKRLEESERQVRETLAAVVDASPVAIICLAADRTVFVWSRAAEQMFGYTAEETIGQPYKLVPEGHEAEFNNLFERAFAGETLRDIYVQRRRKDGSLVDVSFAAAAMYDSDGVRGVAYALADITERKKDEERLKYLAHYDQLTELPNRASLQRDLNDVIGPSAEACRSPTAIAIFDLDEFKDINDTLGHSVGDQLLKEVARRLSSVAERSGRVYRLGGDEFVVVFPQCGDPGKVTAIVTSMLTRLAERFETNGQLLYVRASAGIAIAPVHGANVDDLIANADLALYDAKAAGGRTYRLFFPILRAQAQARRELELELRRAFFDNEFELYFQPQLRLRDGAVVGAEALLRWRHPQRGVLAPGAFIEALTRSPVVHDVGNWILRTACEKAASWRAKGLTPVRIGINLFPAQFRDGALLSDVVAALEQTGLPAEALELEITENIALGHDEALLVPLRALRDKGIGLAFDDFGTGYASLSYLTRYPLSRIKIDQSFVRKISSKSKDTAIIRSIIVMAHNLGLDVVAEGVETAAQAAFLRAEKCDEVQGFLYARPLSSEEFENFLGSVQAASRESNVFG